MDYDLEERTKKFSKMTIAFLKTVPKNEINRSLVSQVIRSATSVGANYHEANGASSRNNFRNKIFICKKEIQETAYWFELIEEANTDKKEALAPLRSEAQQLAKIFGKIAATMKDV